MVCADGRGLPPDDRRHHPGSVAGNRPRRRNPTAEPAEHAQRIHFGGLGAFGVQSCVPPRRRPASRRPESRRRLLQARGVERIAIVDLDVHHGNGTAFIFESDPRVFTFSMHQQHNYPLWKPRGSLDIGLPDGVHDATFLAQLERGLTQVMAHRPQCVFYLAGADPYEDDQLGGLRLTKDGLRRRDRTVMGVVRSAGVPLVVTLAGGYARRVEDTVAIHAATVEEAQRA
jgi:hypothetical protein